MLLTLLYASACGNRNQAQTPPPVPEQTKSEPDNNDLLQALQGKWRSESDSTYVLEILDSKMRHINRDSLTFETDIEVDGACTNTSCQETARLEDGWCFLEKGQFDIQCHRVIKCNSNELQFVAVGVASGPLAFRKTR